ncbi:SET domain containing protein [Rhypophila decipiens]
MAPTSIHSLRGLLLSQILVHLAIAHSPQEAQVPIHSHNHHDQNHNHNPKHNDSRQRQKQAYSHDRGDDESCLPGPLLHPNHPTCVTEIFISDEPSSEFSPWTHEPFCAPGSDKEAESLYCVFTNAKYPSSDKGLSIIANPADPGTEKSLSALATLFESLTNPDSPHKNNIPAKSSKKQEPSTPGYQVTPIKGKGMGLVATRMIRKGQVIMVDYAALLAETVFPSKVKRDVGRELLERAVQRLPVQRRRLVLGLAGSGTDLKGQRRTDGDQEANVEDLVKTNSFTVEVGSGSFMALFPRIARINHACKPSAFTRFDEKTLSNTVLAFRDISKGEEITISYSEFGLTHPERTRLLPLKWNFKCTCSLCTSSPTEIQQSDTRRAKVKALGPQVISQVQSGNFATGIELNKEMVELMHIEGLVPHRGEHWEVMARLLLAEANGLATRARTAGKEGQSLRGRSRALVKEAKGYLGLAIEEIEEFGGSWGSDEVEGEEKIEELRGWLGKL